MFKNVHYINLDKRTDRRALVEAEFLRAGILATRFRALERTPGWKGARDSHLALVRMARNGDLPYVCVFEDDIEFLVTDQTYYAQVFAALPADWQILYLSANTHAPLVRHNEFLYRAKRCLGLHSVVYNSTVYHKLLCDHSSQKITLVDVYLQNIVQPMGHCYVASRLCTVQRSGFSDIEQQEMNQSYIRERWRKHSDGE